MDRRAVLKWEVWGILFIIFVGSSLHFLFALSGSWRAIAWLAAVNESAWEHLKMAFWPTLLWALLEYAFLQVVIFALATYFPPRMFLFTNPHGGGYGIP